VPEERVVLEDEADVALADADVGDVLVVVAHGAVVGDLESRDDSEQGGLAGARGPEQGEERPLGTSRLTLSSARNLSKRLVTRVIRMPIRSEYHRARADEERELRALLGAEHPVQPVERAHGRLPHALRALDPRPSRSAARVASKLSSASRSASAADIRRWSTEACARSVLSSSRMRASSRVCASSRPSWKARKRSGLRTPKAAPPKKRPDAAATQGAASSHAARAWGPQPVQYVPW